MTIQIKQLIACAAAVGAAAVLVGCHSMKTSGGPGSGITDNDVYPYEGGKIDPYVVLEIKHSEGPTTSEGWLTIPIGSFSSGNNGQDCFPTAAGWNKYYVTFYFLGPNVSPPPNPNNYPNTENLSSVTVDTLLLENGTTVDTGIVIMNNLSPTNKVCNDNATPTFANNPKLSKATFSPTASGKKYRAGIFYKSSTIGTNTVVKMHWKYP